MKKLLILIILFLPSIARADQPRFNKLFTSANDKFELRLNPDTWKWSLNEKADNKEIYKLEGNISSMTVLVSDDGKSVVAIDDYSEQDLEKNPEVIFFYHNGNKVKAYKLNEVFDDLDFIVQSVSHFRWLLRNGKDFAINDSKVNLITFEMNNLSFDLETGNLLKKEKDEILSGDAIYVYGKVKGLGGDKHEILVQCVIYGKADKGKKILFNSKEFRWDGSDFKESLIIKDGKLVRKVGIIFNGCD